VKGYNAQLVTTEDQIVIAAEVTVDSPDFGHLEPMMVAARAELDRAGVEASPRVVLGDAGCWHQAQMERLASDGMVGLVPPDANKRGGARPGWDGGSTHSCAACWPPSTAARSTPSARSWSSPCSPTASSTAASIASCAAAQPRPDPNGAWSTRPTTAQALVPQHRDGGLSAARRRPQGRPPCPTPSTATTASLHARRAVSMSGGRGVRDAVTGHGLYRGEIGGWRERPGVRRRRS
jgi:hypothetical protein